MHVSYYVFVFIHTARELYLDGEDLNGHVFVQHLGLPDAAEAPPGLHLQQLQRLETQQGGGRGGARILEDAATSANITETTHSNKDHVEQRVPC